MDNKLKPCECGAEVCHKCALKRDGDCNGCAPDEPETEQCGRCGALILKGQGVCDNCACDLRYEAEDYHQRMSEAYERGEL